MGGRRETDAPRGEAESQTSTVSRTEEIDQLMKELEEQAQKQATEQLQGRGDQRPQSYLAERVGPGIYVTADRYGQEMQRTREQAQEEALGGNPNDHTEETQREKTKQNEYRERDEGKASLRGARTTYERHVARHRDERKKMSQEIAMYDAEEHWRLGFAAENGQ